MRFSTTTTASLLASTAAAFSDSSPLVLFSTSKLSIPAGEASQLQSTTRALHTTHDILASCPTSRYVLISQPNVHASDLRNPQSGVCHSANLCAAVDDRAVRGRFDVAEVIGDDDISTDALSSYIKAACAEQGKTEGLAVEEHRLEALPAQKGEARATKLAENDVEIGDILSGVRASGDDDYTVIYFSSPHSSAVYESEYVESAAIQMELKRRTGEVVAVGPRAGGNNNASDSSSAPLFVKYQFFTPGIFMGIVALIIMLSLLYVGLSAVASLEVSYGAFDKENGPAAQKKNN